MIVTVSGIKRSGSTVQYNIVRLILLEMGYTVNLCLDQYKGRELHPGHVDLYKIHKFNKDLADTADYIFLTDRVEGEIADSLQKFNGKRPSKAKIYDMQKHLNLWFEYDNSYLMYYDMFCNDLMVLIDWIKDVLGANKVDSRKILHHFNEISLPVNGQDKETLFFHNHISNKI